MSKVDTESLMEKAEEDLNSNLPKTKQDSLLYMVFLRKLCDHGIDHCLNTTKMDWSIIVRLERLLQAEVTEKDETVREDRIPEVYSGIDRHGLTRQEIRQRMLESENEYIQNPLYVVCSKSYLPAPPSHGQYNEEVFDDYSYVYELTHEEEVFFSYQGADQHIQQNKHRYTEPHITIKHCWRNPEMYYMMSWLLRQGKEVKE